MDNEELIRKRAYEIWEERCHSEVWDYGNRGTANGDWTQAKQEIEAEAHGSSPR